MTNWIILGLGNPGEKFENTRHNISWWALDIISNELSGYKKYEKKEKNHIEYRFDHKNWNVYLIYPSTYVNNSGLALKYLLNNNKFSLDKVIIISDDINLEEGRLRIRRKGSSGGHNGLNSIINHIGSENFIRVKIGIGKPRSNEDQIKYVLSKVKNKKTMYKSCEKAAEACLSIMDKGLNISMEKYNGVKDE
jgi:PTH1 family peptidyl-tRNA hydrolase|tara:strand:+ start:84783 stop:85361 length:579 start_codon:yes stop_codon:yes gene_type:complete